MKIQADVTTILNDNQELRKDVENLKTSMQFHAEMVDAIKTQNEKLVSTNNALHSEVFDLGKRVQTLEYEHDALAQYTRKFNIEIMAFQNSKVKTCKTLSSKRAKECQ